MKRLFKRKKAELSVTGISDQPEGDGAGGSVPPSAQGPGAGQPVLARAIADYSSEDPDDLTFRAGQVIEVTDPGEGPESWWEGRLDGREGCFPGTFVMLMGQSRPKTFTAPEDQDPGEVTDVLANTSRLAAEESAFADRLGPTSGGDDGKGTSKMVRSAMKGKSGLPPKTNRCVVNLKANTKHDTHHPSDYDREADFDPASAQAEWEHEEEDEKRRILEDRWSYMERDLPAGEACDERKEFERLWAEQERQLKMAEERARMRREERKKKLQAARAARAAKDKKTPTEAPIGAISAPHDNGVGEASIDDMGGAAASAAPDEDRGDRLKRLAAERAAAKPAAPPPPAAAAAAAPAKVLDMSFTPDAASEPAAAASQPPRERRGPPGMGAAATETIGDPPAAPIGRAPSKLELLKKKKAAEAATVAADISGGDSGAAGAASDAVARAIDELRGVCRGLSERDGNNRDGFQRNFSQLDRDDKSNWDPQLCSAGLRYPDHNRYRDIMPWDRHRVKLNDPEQDVSRMEDYDYINASLITGILPGAPDFIAAQGPKKATVETFWKMVWQQRTRLIIMVTNLKEGEKIKCWRYWPHVGGDVTFPANEWGGQVHVVLDSEEKEGPWVRRKFSLTSFNPDVGAMEEMSVTQLHFLAWPDRGVPESSVVFLNFLRSSMAQQSIASSEAKASGETKPPPVTVHCSAGVGRTGVFCLVYSCLTYLPYLGQDGNTNIEVHDTIVRLRQHRRYMVQTMDQYKFCHRAVLHAAKLYLDGSRQLSQGTSPASTTPAAAAATPPPQPTAEAPQPTAAAGEAQGPTKAGEMSDPGFGITVSQVGSAVTVVNFGAGTLRYVGFSSSGSPCCGVELDEGGGLHDGTVDGVQYFQCAAQRGVLVHPKNVTVIPAKGPAAVSPPAVSPSESPLPADGSFGEDGAAVVRKRSLRQRVGEGIKKRFSVSKDSGPIPENGAVVVSPRQPAEFQPPPEDVVRSPYKHGGRLLQVSGRRGYLTFMNSNFQQLKEDCEGLPAFKMQQPIGDAHGPLTGLYAFLYKNSGSWVMALMGAGVVAISNSEAPSPDQGYWFVLNEKAQLVEDRNLVVQFAQKSMKRSVSASSTTGSVGPAVTDTAEVQTLRMELELSRANERKYRKDLEAERVRSRDLEAALAKATSGGAAPAQGSPETDEATQAHVAHLEEELQRLMETENDLATVLTVVSELEAQVGLLEEAQGATEAKLNTTTGELEAALAENAELLRRLRAAEGQEKDTGGERNPFGVAPTGKQNGTDEANLSGNGSAVPAKRGLPQGLILGEPDEEEC